MELSLLRRTLITFAGSVLCYLSIAPYRAGPPAAMSALLTAQHPVFSVPSIYSTSDDTICLI